jgi:YVTN family beta-propeller protein
MIADVQQRIRGAALAHPRFPAVQHRTISLGRKSHSAYHAFTPDGTKAYVVNQATSDLAVLDVKTHLVVDTIPIPSADEPWDMAVMPDGRTALITNSAFTRNRLGDLAPSRVVVLDLASGAERARIPAGTGSNGIAFDPRRGRAFVANTRSDTVSVIDVEAAQKVAEIAVGTAPLGVAYSRSADLILVACYRADDLWCIRPEDLTTYHHRVVEDIRTKMEALADEKCGPAMRSVQVACHPQRPEAYITDFAAGQLIFVDLIEHAVFDRLTLERMPYGIDVSPDGEWLLVTYDSRRYITAIRTEDRTSQGTFEFPAQAGVIGDLLPIRFRPGSAEAWVTDGENDEILVFQLHDLVG